MGRPPTSADLSTKPFFGGAPVILPSGEVPFAAGFMQNFAAGPIIQGAAGAIGRAIGEGIAGGVAGQVTEEILQYPTAQVTAIAPGGQGQLCWVTSDVERTQRARMKRRRIKIIARDANGNPVFGGACAPRRMNPLNPRALGRAGRRVAAFCRVATGMQKMLQSVVKGNCKPKRRSFSLGPGCGPKKRCR